MNDELTIFKGDINDINNIEKNINNIYFTSGQSDSDYRLYIGEKLLAKCDSINELQNQIDLLNSDKADKTEIPTHLSDLVSDSENRTVTDSERNKWNSYNGVVYSETEFIVGKWVDGRDIYRRTIIYEVNDLGTEVTSGKTNHWAYIEVLSGSNIDMFVKMEGTAFCTSDKHEKGVWQPIPRVVPDACENYSIGFGDFNATGKIGVLFRRKIYNSNNIFDC